MNFSSFRHQKEILFGLLGNDKSTIKSTSIVPILNSMFNIPSDQQGMFKFFFDLCDVDENGELDFNEFVNLLNIAFTFEQNQRHLLLAFMLTLFYAIDKNNDKRITRDEIISSLNKIDRTNPFIAQFEKPLQMVFNYIENMKQPSINRIDFLRSTINQNEMNDFFAEEFEEDFKNYSKEGILDFNNFYKLFNSQFPICEESNAPSISFKLIDINKVGFITKEQYIQFASCVNNLHWKTQELNVVDFYTIIFKYLDVKTDGLLHKSELQKLFYAFNVPLNLQEQWFIQNGDFITLDQFISIYENPQQHLKYFIN